jgi:hypothetical protein
MSGALVGSWWMDVKNHGFCSISTPFSSGISRVFDMFDVFDWYQTSVDQVFNALNWESWRSWSQVIAAVDCHCRSFCVTWNHGPWTEMLVKSADHLWGTSSSRPWRRARTPSSPGPWGPSWWKWSTRPVLFGHGPSPIRHFGASNFHSNRL